MRRLAHSSLCYLSQHHHNAARAAAVRARPQSAQPHGERDGGDAWGWTAGRERARRRCCCWHTTPNTTTHTTHTAHPYTHIYNHQQVKSSYDYQFAKPALRWLFGDYYGAGLNSVLFLAPSADPRVSVKAKIGSEDAGALGDAGWTGLDCCCCCCCCCCCLVVVVMVVVVVVLLLLLVVVVCV